MCRAPWTDSIALWPWASRECRACSLPNLELGFESGQEQLSGCMHTPPPCENLEMFGVRACGRIPPPTGPGHPAVGSGRFHLPWFLVSLALPVVREGGGNPCTPGEQICWAQLLAAAVARIGVAGGMGAGRVLGPGPPGPQAVPGPTAPSLLLPWLHTGHWSPGASAHVPGDAGHMQPSVPAQAWWHLPLCAGLL